MKKLFKIAAYSYIIILILGFVLGTFYGFSSGFIPITSLNSVVWIFHIISFILSVLALYGFIALGKKFKNKFLIITSYIGIILFFFYLLYILFGSFFLNVPEIPNFNSIGQDINNFIIFLMVAYLIYSVIFGIYAIFFGIALLKLKKKIKYSKSAGILNIVAGATMFIYLGNLVMIAAIIMEILLLFDVSRRFETNKSRFLRK